MASGRDSGYVGERIDFLPWLSGVMQVITSLESDPDSNAATSVDCGDCEICCTHSRVPVSEKEASNPALKAIWTDSGWIIPKDGTKCIHLKNGCEIYEDRPATCRAFDCRKRIIANMIDPHTLEMGKRWDLTHWFTDENEIFINAIRLAASNYHAQHPDKNISAIVSYAIMHWPEYLGIVSKK